MNEGLSRRNFLKGAAIGASSAALLSLAGCSNDDTGSSASAAPGEEASGGTPEWTHEADVVVVGGGAVGVAAAIRAKDQGASVIIVEANYAAGGHALTSGGHVHLGCGTSLQKRMGIEDSADQYYLDHTSPTSERDRANIREVVRAAAESHAEAFEFLLDNGWTHQSDETIRADRIDSVPRTITTNREDEIDDIDPIGPGGRKTPGVALMRTLERSARAKGVEFIMNHHMDAIVRDGASGNVVGIEASYTPRIMPDQTEPLVDFDEFLEGNIDAEDKSVSVKANKAVVIATGGSSSNWKFHSLFDSRYGPEHANGCGGDPFSFQDASGELAVMAIGGTIGATQVGVNLAPARAIGTQYGYRHRTIGEGAPVFPLVRSYGLDIDSEDTAKDGLIYVNMLGERFVDETVVPDSPELWEPALSSVITEVDGKLTRLAGPTWAIFDDEWAKTMEWDMTGPPSVDWEDGYIFKADTIEDLASQVVNKFYEDIKMDPATLAATIERYNGFVDTGVDEDFEREKPSVKIGTAPFYAAWIPNAFHDTLIGVLINEKFQVLDMNREVIPHLYAGGEVSAGQGMHGHGKNFSNAYAIGTNVMDEPNI